MVNIAEAQSTGAVMVRYETSYTDDNTSSPMYTKSKRLAQFFARSREHFVDRSSIAPVAVLYAYGSVIWRSFGSLRTDGGASTNYVGTHLHWTNVPASFAYCICNIHLYVSRWSLHVNTMFTLHIY